MRMSLVNARPIPTLPRWAAARGVLATAFLMLVASAAGAHEFWLTPTRYLLKAHAASDIGAVAGTGFRGETMPYSSLRCVRWTARTDRTLDLARVAGNGEMIWTRFAPADDRGALLAFESTFTPIELPAPEFNAYLKLEGLDGPLAARGQTAAPGRERYRRCAKTWLAGSDAVRATRPVGLPLEIVPQSSPGTTLSLRVRVLAEGRPLAGALVRAWRTPLDASGLPRDPAVRDSVGPAWQGRSDARGEAVVPVTNAGEWIVSCVRMVPCGDRAVADWESSWASLTFVRPASPKPR